MLTMEDKDGIYSEKSNWNTRQVKKHTFLGVLA